MLVMSRVRLTISLLRRQPERKRGRIQGMYIIYGFWARLDFVAYYKISVVNTYMPVKFSNNLINKPHSAILMTPLTNAQTIPFTFLDDDEGLMIPRSHLSTQFVHAVTSQYLSEPQIQHIKYGGTISTTNHNSNIHTYDL